MNRTRKTSSLASRRSRFNAGFTLLEMLVVMVIIGLLAGLVGPRIFGKVDDSKVKAARTQVKMLESAVGIMQLDIGNIPPKEAGLKWLSEAPTDPNIKPKWNGPYIDGKLPNDPWDRPYAYVVPGANGRAFSVVSYGADGQAGGEGLDADIGVE
jgi:general secretion pathway protein G